MKICLYCVWLAICICVYYIAHFIPFGMYLLFITVNEISNEIVVGFIGLALVLTCGYTANYNYRHINWRKVKARIRYEVKKLFK